VLQARDSSQVIALISAIRWPEIAETSATIFAGPPRTSKCWQIDHRLEFG